MQTSATFVSTRVLIQNALSRYNNRGNNTAANWVNSIADLQAAVGGDASLGQGLLLQTRIWPRDAAGPGSVGGLLNVTAQSVLDSGIQLPYAYANGTAILLGANDTDVSTPMWTGMIYANGSRLARMVFRLLYTRTSRTSQSLTTPPTTTRGRSTKMWSLLLARLYSLVRGKSTQVLTSCRYQCRSATTMHSIWFLAI